MAFIFLNKIKNLHSIDRLFQIFNIQQRSNLIINSKTKMITINILIAFLCISMIQANDEHSNIVHRHQQHQHHHHNHHHHLQNRHHQYLQHQQQYSSNYHVYNSQPIKNNKNWNFNEKNYQNITNSNLDRRKIHNNNNNNENNVTTEYNKISNRSLKFNLKTSNLHKRNSLDNNRKSGKNFIEISMQSNNDNKNIDILDNNYNGLNTKFSTNSISGYNNYNSISNNNYDNVLHDVEIIKEKRNVDENYDIATAGPPPIPVIPTTMSTITTTPAATQTPPTVIKEKTFHKMNDGRHICVQHKTIQIPVKTREIYSRPTWRHVTEPCEENQICTRIQLVHEPIYRDIVRHKSTRQVTYECCPGWEPTTKNANSCMKPVCKIKCKNGGTCIKPDTCSCPQGFTGKFCEQDINECETEKPCDQFCYNTEGSYYCECKSGFILMNDKQSCKKITADDDAFEARDLENDIDTDTSILNTRIEKLEKMIANDRVATNELYKNAQTTSHLIDSLKTRLSTLEKQQQDISHLQDKLLSNDAKTKSLEYLVNILLKCQKNPNTCQQI